jgi:hypothetical protein
MSYSVLVTFSSAGSFFSGKDEPSLNSTAMHVTGSEVPSGGKITGILLGVLIIVALAAVVVYLVLSGKSKAVIRRIRNVGSPGGRLSTVSNAGTDSVYSDTALMAEDPEFHGDPEAKY